MCRLRGMEGYTFGSRHDAQDKKFSVKIRGHIFMTAYLFCTISGMTLV